MFLISLFVTFNHKLDNAVIQFFIKIRQKQMTTNFYLPAYLSVSIQLRDEKIFPKVAAGFCCNFYVLYRLANIFLGRGNFLVGEYKFRGVNLFNL